VLKKVRVAFELKDDDVIALLQRTGLRVSKAELGSFFRRPDTGTIASVGTRSSEIS